MAFKKLASIKYKYMEDKVLTKAVILKLGFEDLEVLAMHIKVLQSPSKNKECPLLNPFEMEPFKSANIFGKVNFSELEKLSKDELWPIVQNQAELENFANSCSPAVPGFRFTRFSLD